MCMSIRNIPITPTFLVLSVVLLITCSCTSRENHLTLYLEKSTATPIQQTRNTAKSTQTPWQNTPQNQAPTAVFETPTMVSELPATTVASVTSALVLTPTSTFSNQLQTATVKPATQQASTLTFTPTQVRTSTPTLTVTATQTPTATPTLATTQQTDWTGEWIVFWQLDDQTYIEGTISIELAGTNFTASGTLGGLDYSFNGRIVEQGLTAFGSWTSLSGNGNFIWGAVADGQFGGSRDLYFGFCGVRPGFVQPEPCYIPPLS